MKKEVCKTCISFGINQNKIFQYKESYSRVYLKFIGSFDNCSMIAFFITKVLRKLGIPQNESLTCSLQFTENCIIVFVILK